MRYEDFRLALMPDLQTPGQWSVQVTSCATPGLAGPKGTASIHVTPAQLARLRDAQAWPDQQELARIGADVWRSIMSPAAAAAFKAELAVLKGQNKAMRLVISVLGDRPDGAAPGGNGTVAPDELPIEALFDDDLRFIATDVQLPLSRGLSFVPDRKPIKLAPPLRVLLVAASPTDQPPTDAAREEAAIAKALEPLVAAGAVELKVCHPPTKERLRTMLQAGYHVLHFIGHGAFRVVGNDPTPRPHLCFEDETPQRESDPVTAEQLLVMLRASAVQLVVMTSCASAAATPHGPYPVKAMGSLVQVLLGNPNGPAAAVAMQFDLETDAARVFSAAFYERLMRSDSALDEAVAEARAKLMLQFGAGHRCFVNPVIYWRVEGGRLFEWDNLVAGGLSDAERAQLAQIDGEEQVVLKLLDDMAALPADQQTAVAPLRQQWQARVADLARLRGELLGETLRLRGGTPGADGVVECALTLRLRRPVKVGDVRVQVLHDPAQFDWIAEAAGAAAPAGSLFVQAGATTGRVILLTDVSAGQLMPAGEHELALLKLRRRPGVGAGTLRVPLAHASVTIEGQALKLRCLDAIVFAP